MVIHRSPDHPNNMLNDPYLTWAAKGVMMLFYSCDNPWAYISMKKQEDREAVEELIEMGYLEKKELDENQS